MIINGEDATKVARREYGRMIGALHAEPFGNPYWAQNVVTAWQKLERHDDLRGILEARIADRLSIQRIAEIWDLPACIISDVIRTWVKEIDCVYHDPDEELSNLW